MELQILAWDRNNNVSVLNRLMEYSSDHLISSDNTSTYIKNMTLEELHSQSITILKSPISPKIEIAWKFESHDSYKIFQMNLNGNYTSWPIILPNMKAIGPTTSEELHSQN
jgi:hypothetical protein